MSIGSLLFRVFPVKGGRSPSFAVMSYGMQRRLPGGAVATARIMLGALLICGVAAGPALARKRHHHIIHHPVVYSQELSTTEALNEQQLQALSAPGGAVSGGCAEGVGTAPRSLSGSLTPCGESVAAPSEATASGWILYAGGLVGRQLVGWGQAAGWHVLWNCGRDWVVPSSVAFHGDFTSAASQVLEDLAAEGASVHGVFYQGNRTLVISGGSQ